VWGRGNKFDAMCPLVNARPEDLDTAFIKKKKHNPMPSRPENFMRVSVIVLCTTCSMCKYFRYQLSCHQSNLANSLSSKDKQTAVNRKCLHSWVLFYEINNGGWVWLRRIWSHCALRIVYRETSRHGNAVFLEITKFPSCSTPCSDLPGSRKML
jgi:hypothetical protein